MDDKYNVLKLVQQRKDEDNAKTRHQAGCKDKLAKMVEKRIRTTMIGALAAVEEKFGMLWENDGKMNREQEKAYSLFQEIRSSILDKGNDQIRQLEKDLEYFVVELRRITLEFKLDKPEGKE